MTVPSPQLGRPIGADGEETRRRIIAAAMRCVAESGCARATIREIARTAGMTSGSLYHYFPNKSELLRATVTAIEEVALPRLRAAAGSGGGVAERLDAVLDESDRLMREYPRLAAFERAVCAESAAGPRRSAHDHGGFTALRDVIGDIVDDAGRAGALADGVDGRGATGAIHALTRGLTDRAADLTPDEYHAAVRSAKRLIRGTLL